MQNYHCLVCLFVYVEVLPPVNPLGSCWARPVYLTTLLLDRVFAQHSVGSQSIFQQQRLWSALTDVQSRFLLGVHVILQMLCPGSFMLYLQTNISCGHSLKRPHQDESNKYPHDMFGSKSNNNCFLNIPFIWTCGIISRVYPHGLKMRVPGTPKCRVKGSFSKI